MQTVVNYIVDNIVSDSAILLGMVSALGLILLKKRWDEVLKGAFLAAIGMTIITQAIEILKMAIIPIEEISGPITDSSQSFLVDYGGAVGISMLFGMIIHVLIARFTKIKTIFLTGHMLFWIPFVFVAAGVEAGLTGWALWISSAVASALYWSFMPWLVRKLVFKVIGDKSFTLGHPAGILTLIAAGVARLVRKKDGRSTEDLKLSKRFAFFREISITGGIVIFLLYIVVGIVYKDLLYSLGESIVFHALGKGLLFAAGLSVLLMGVRMLIGQIVPAFEGISSKVVKNALPAYDCPMLFNYRPNAVIIGFLVSLFVSSAVLVACNIFNVFNGVILIPLIVTCFFECGTAAVIADGQGGLRGAIIGTAVASIVMVGLVGVSAVFFKNTIQPWILVSGGNDFSLFGPIVGWIEKFIVGLFA